MADQLVRGLVIEEDFQDEIKYTLEHSNESYVDWCALSYKGRITIRLNLPLHMIWAGIRDPLVGYMNPIAGMPSSLVVEARGSLERSSIPRPVRSVMLQKVEEKKHKNISVQRTSREAQKLWRLLLY